MRLPFRRTLAAAAFVTITAGVHIMTASLGSGARAQDQKRGKRPEPLTAPIDAKTARASQQAWAKHLGKPDFVETNSLGMKLVFIPPGEFQMGISDEDVDKILKTDADLKREEFAESQPRHRVRITRGFYMGAHEVTQA